MEVTQIKQLVNDATREILGEEATLLTEDLSNVVDIGTEIFNANAVDKYVKSLVNHIGKVVFVDRVYRGSAPSVLMDGWEFGSVLEKIQAEMPQASENESWELNDGESYDPNVFYKPIVSAKFFNSKVTFEVNISFTEKQVKQSFSSVAQLNGFISMIYNSVDKSMTVKFDALIMRTINNMIGETVYSEYAGGSQSASSGVRAVNLLKLYNTRYNQNISASDAITTPDFIRYASYIIGMYKDRLSKMSTVFNIGGKERFTPEDMLHIVMLSDFEKASNAFLQSDTYHEMYTKLPNAETVPYWQGSGSSFAFDDVSSIKVKTSGDHTITVGGIIAVMFDRDALGVCNLDKRVTNNYNPKAEFYTNFYKFDAGYFNDLNENFVVFFVA